jgi:glycosyltransferase involved in cell wall biosynthesis
MNGVSLHNNNGSNGSHARIQRPKTRRSGDGRLRIAQLAPLYESVPPKMYGGTERVVAYLTEELLRRGHEVTLFASGDSTLDVPIHAGWPVSLRNAALSHRGPDLHLRMLSEVYGHADRFDVIHSHLDYWNFAMARIVETPTVATLHGRMDIAEVVPVWRCFPDVPVVSVSDSQRAPIPDLNWIGTVHHGIPAKLLNFHPERGKYLAFLGRIAPEKRPDLAIEVARRAGVPIKIAAKVDKVDREYFEAVIRPLISAPEVEFIGEINDEFLGNAYALLFSIDWPEPFGLAMIEAMACGTPVIARPCGSVPEVVRNGVSGFIAASVEEMVAAVHQVDDLSRENCRKEFESRFTVARMVDKYEQLYRQLLSENRPRLGGTRVAAI